MKLVPIVFKSFLVSVFHPVFWAVVFLIVFLNHRQAGIKLFWNERLDMSSRYISLLFMEYLVVWLCYIMVFFGISLTGIGIGYLWMLAVILMLINQRFICLLPPVG